MPAPLTVDLLWRLDRLSAVSLSPDGSQAVCLVNGYDMARNRGHSALWLFDVDGRRPPRRLTTAAGRHAAPVWSPCGGRIAFIGQREQQGGKDERPQLYLIDAAGGEARRAPVFAAGVETARWLPDGRGLLFSAWVWPELRGARAQQARWRAHAARKESGYATGQAQYRHWDRPLPMDRVLHLHHLDLASGRIVDLFEGTAFELPRDAATPEPFDAGPDGRSVAFACDPADEKRSGARRAIFELDRATRRVRRLADDADWDFGLPRYAADGRRIAMLAARVGSARTMPSRPALVDRERRGARWHALGLDWDHDAGSAPRWTPDGSAILLTAEARGRRHLWRCVPDGAHGRFEVAVEGGWVQDFDVAGRAHEERLVTVMDAALHPPRLHVHRWSAPPRRLDRFNDRRLARAHRGRVDEVTIAGAGGDPVQMWLTFPPGFDARRRHPVLHVIHGGPHAAAGDTWSWRWNAHVLASRGHVVVQVNYHGSSGFGHAFRHSIVGRLARLEAHDIEAATDWLRGQRWVDRDRLYATGGSYGGFLVAWLNGHAAPGRYRAHVCHAGVFDRVATFAADSWARRRDDLGGWYWDIPEAVRAQSPHAAAAHMRTPTLVIHGALDYRVPDCNGLAYYNTLKARGVDARLLWFPDENHWVLQPCNARQWHDEFFAWLRRHGGTGAAVPEG